MTDLRALFSSPELAALIDAAECDGPPNEARRQQARRRDAVVESGIHVTPEDVEAVASGVYQDGSPWIETLAVKITRAWLRGGAAVRSGPRPRFLGLFGGTGVGKTVAAAWAIAEQGGGLAVSAGELGRLMLGFRRDDARVERILRTRLLVVDDLGTEPSTIRDFGAALFELVDTRQTRDVLTILTSNGTEAEFVARYGDRTYQRMCHSGVVGSVAGRNLRTGDEETGAQLEIPS